MLLNCLCHFFLNFISTQFSSHIKIIRSDNGAEFVSLRSFFIVLNFNVLVFTPHNRMALSNEIIATFYKLLVLYFFNLMYLCAFGVSVC